ncbi:hypothetical protein KI387_035331 [Taxus chinensis]|uniref:Uncharacterized protein n=1 Tax=Taxus chinensis TaxID=29808 RepID=A0AA38FNC3_TAXCH|nr:hypothetical protein KI387_035331 [Taxus chinensis]
MALWMEAGSIPTTEKEQADVDAINALRESSALELKEKGNEYIRMGKKHYADAIDCYTRAINQKISNNVENSILFANRAHANLLLGNYRRALMDAEDAIKINSKNVKAYYRGAKAALALESLAEAGRYCRSGLEQFPSNMELEKLVEQVNMKQTEIDSLNRQASEALSTAEALVSALDSRSLKLGKAMYKELTGVRKPRLDESGILHWPVLFLYGEANAGWALPKRKVLEYFLEDTAGSIAKRFEGEADDGDIGDDSASMSGQTSVGKGMVPDDYGSALSYAFIVITSGSSSSVLCPNCFTSFTVQMLRPKNEKPIEDMTLSDYESTYISLGLASHEGDSHLFKESTSHLLTRNEEYKQTIVQLEEQVKTLSAYIQPFLEFDSISSLPLEDIPLINNVDPEAIKKAQGYIMQGKANEKWVEKIIEQGKALFPKVISLIKYNLVTLSEVKKAKEEFAKEVNHLDELFPSVSEMSPFDPHTLVSKNVFASAADNLSQVWICIIDMKYGMLKTAISELETCGQQAFGILNDVYNCVQKLEFPPLTEDSSSEELIVSFQELVKKEAGDSLSFNEDNLESLANVRSCISEIAKDHEIWLSQCKKISEVPEAWTKVLGYVCILETDKLAHVVA